ncbi:MAG: Rieske 2Fe-2S domain-containing protein [Proteobacteria bacterium]|nr:Rieske 2Fe-2S domain-containing protein [Pseudomonadota bacterium]
MTFIDSDDIKSLVAPGRVHQRVYTDPEIFDLEMSRIFERSWIYAGHESQIREPGDFIRTQIGRHDVLIVRTDDVGIAGLYNRCAHRGAQIVGAAEGNIQTFNCPYHGWSYAKDGSLIAIPVKEDYGAGFDPSDRRYHLRSIERLAVHRGFIFVRTCAAGPDLETYLEPIVDSLDNMIDRSPTGELEYGGNHFRQVFHGNWKLSVENSIDAAHATFVHNSSATVAKAWERDHHDLSENSEQVIKQIKSNDLTPRQWNEIAVYGLRNGHGHLGGFYREGKLAPESDDPVFQGYKRSLIDRYGTEKTQEILAIDRFNSVVYPNLTINIRFQVLRYVEPVSVDKSIVHAVGFRMKGAPEEMFRASVRTLNAFNSPSSLISQDDLAVFQRTQAGFRSSNDPWIDFSRGSEIDYDVPNGKRGGSGTSEVLHRAQYDMWLSLMTVAS